MILVTVTPKLRFRQTHNILIKLINTETKVEALKLSGFTTQGRHGEYDAPVATKIHFEQELHL